MRLHRLIILFLFSVFPTILGAQEVSVEFDPRIHFPYLKSFTWGKGTPAIRPEVDKMIVAEVEKQLISKGLKHRDSAPDLRVVYHASTEKQIRTDESGYSVGEWGDAKKKAEPVTAGTLVVDLVNPNKKTLVWRGTAQAVVVGDLAKMEQTIKQAAQEMFKDFPPGKR